MVEKQVAGCDVPVQVEMPIGTLLHAVGQRGFDGNIPPRLGFDDHMLGSVLLEDRLLGEFGDCILAVGLDDAVGEAVLHDKTLEMLYLMSCWPLSGRDDRAA